MPKLPDPSAINRQAPTPSGPSGFLQQNNISTPRADTSIGDALSQIGEEAYKFAMVEKARMDNVAINDAKNKYKQKVLDLTAEYGKIKSKNAVDKDIVSEYSTKLSNFAETLGTGFKNNDQKEAFKTFSDSANVQFKAGVLQHKLTESDRYDDETHVGLINVNTNFAISNFANQRIVEDSDAEIRTSLMERAVKLGWGKDYAKDQLNKALGPFAYGIASQFINAKQYDMAKEYLEKYKTVLGDKYGDLNKSIQESEVIDLSQEHAAKILGTIPDEEEQRKAARAIGGTVGDATLTRIKTYQNEQRVQAQENKRVQSENDLKWINEVGVEALNGKTLTVEQVKQAGLSDQNEALWMQKVFEQGVSTGKQAITQNSDNVYAEWIKRVTLNPEKYTPEDIAKDINPNGGGLTGPQYSSVLSELESQKVTTPKTVASAANTKGKSLLTSMYERGDFGKVKTEKDKYGSESWKTYQNILIGYQQKIIEDPNTDHTEWLNMEFEKDFKGKLYKQLDADWTFGPFRDESEEIIKKNLELKNIEPTPENINKYRNQYKLDKTGSYDAGVVRGEIKYPDKKKTVRVFKDKIGQAYYTDSNGKRINVTVKDGKVQF